MQHIAAKRLLVLMPPRTNRDSMYPDHNYSEMDESCETDSSTLVAGENRRKCFSD